MTDDTAPLFIVGMPRSGTKLLRTLLNQHPEIFIPENESHFIPRLAASYGSCDKSALQSSFDEIYREVANSNFGRRLTERAVFLSREQWRAAVREWTIAGVLRALLETLCRDQGKRIWGDKTPQYLTQLPLLDELFPRARFIHIVRDVRDYCLSINKAWGKNMYRASSRWNEETLKCARDGAALGPQRFQTVHYEQLVQSPESALAPVLTELDITYDERVSVLKKSAENIGAAKGATEIMAANLDKWTKQMRVADIEKIESLSFDALTHYEYPITQAMSHVRPSSTQMQLWKINDGLRMMLFEARDAQSMKESLLNTVSNLRYRTNRY